MLMLYTALIDEEEDLCRFEKIYSKYRERMWMVAEHILHNNADAQDAVQNALIGIAKHINTVPAHSERVIRAYVLTAAKNAALNIQRTRKSRNEIGLEEWQQEADPEELLRKVVASQDYALLLNAMRKLEPPYREVLMLVYVQEQSIQAAADILSRPRETVRKQLYRGKKRLIALCREEGFFDD